MGNPFGGASPSRARASWYSARCSSYPGVNLAGWYSTKPGERRRASSTERPRISAGTVMMVLARLMRRAHCAPCVPWRNTEVDIFEHVSQFRSTCSATTRVRLSRTHYRPAYGPRMLFRMCVRNGRRGAYRSGRGTAVRRMTGVSRPRHTMPWLKPRFRL